MPPVYRGKRNANLPQPKKEDVAKEFEKLEEDLGFEIAPCTQSLDLNNTNRFTKLETDTYQKESINMLLGMVPQTASAGTLLQTYIAKFPANLPVGAELMSSSKVPTGVYSAITADNKIVAHATFHSTQSLGIAMGVFSAMSIVTGQYFLSQINSELGRMNVKLDEVLEFLKGEKNSELLSEIAFVKYAYKNFNSIMKFENQKIATISNVQAAKKIAIKDMEFYMNSLESLMRKTHKSFEDICESCEKAFGIARDIETSRNLYIFSTLLDIYFSQNYEPAFIQFLRDETLSYIKACDERIALAYQFLKDSFDNYEYHFMEVKKEHAKEKNMSLLTNKIKPLIDGSNSPILHIFEQALDSISSDKEYVITTNGDVYIKRNAN